jgi:hypothetical protein
VRTLAGAAAGVAARAAGRAALAAIADATSRKPDSSRTARRPRAPREQETGATLGPDGMPGPFGV